MTKPESSGPFDDAEIISSYSRAEAIADGVLVDVTPKAKEAGFKVPIALTAAVRARLEPSEHDARLGQSFEGRLWDVLMVLRHHAGSSDADTVTFEVIIAEMDEQHTIHLKAHIGPGDTAEPVVTIMFEHED
jgi:hypothetical protein